MTFSTADWSQRYQSGDTPWDLGGPHPELSARIAAGLVPSGDGQRRALVPGCGRGHDALALAEAGWLVTAIDVVDPTGGELGAALARKGGEYRVEDALAHVPRRAYDLMFEHTFFCAIDPSLRARWGELAARALGPHGRLCALLFPVGKPASDGGPPFGVTLPQLLEVLPGTFQVVVDEPVKHGIARRSFPERWAELERTS